MNTNIKSALYRFRITAFTEGISYLILLFIAMPLKYIFAMPGLVKIVGMIHGILFVAFVVTLIDVTMQNKWKANKAIFAFILSLIPFGTFYLDKKLKEEAIN
ncbi:MAG: DUF3817 domain-containing protein [Bacteroidetes bacterium]|nr:DUF3817 domain-containing protein [Bacteroidota bacterium]